MDSEIDYGNVRIPEILSDWLAMIGGKTNIRLPFPDELSCGGIPNIQTMWSLTAQRCSDLPVASLSTQCRIKARFFMLTYIGSQLT
jgi:hypothetical protein